MRVTIPVVLTALSLLAVPVLAQSTTKAGGEFQVNTTTAGDQRNSTAVMTPDGSATLVVWEGALGDDFGIHGRGFDRSGAPLGPEFVIAPLSEDGIYPAGVQPVAAVDAAGRFTVVWSAPDGDAAGIFARRVSPSLGPLGAAFQVNVHTTSRQITPRVAAGPGGVAVVWQSLGQDGDEWGVYGRLFTASGLPLTDDVRLSATAALSQKRPVVAALDDGRWAAAWLNETSLSELPHAASRILDPSFVPLDTEVQIPEPPLGMPYNRREYLGLAPQPLGEYVLSLYEATGIGGKFGAQSFDVGSQVIAHDGDGTPGTRTTVASAGPGADARWQPAIAANPGGGLLMAYTSHPQVNGCFSVPPSPPPAQCPPPTGESDGHRSGIFIRALPGGSPGAPFQVNTTIAGYQTLPSVAQDAQGNAIVVWQSRDQDGSGEGLYAQRLGGLFPIAAAVDAAGNGVLDPGESAAVAPSWQNQTGAAVNSSGMLASFAGPAGGTYTIEDAAAVYGGIPNGATRTCTDCYTLRVSFAGPRPATHVDSSMAESLTPSALGLQKAWRLHVGGSFADVPAPSPFYRFAETLLHHGITSGCGAGTFCPAAATAREQMAVFVLVSKEGPGYQPPACTTPAFGDVPAASPFCRWIEELARRGVAGGCGDGNFCPAQAVSREQMAVFVLRTLDPALDPPACTTPLFGDVPASSPFCRWVEEMARRGITTGCGGGNFCPQASVTREQMAVFLSTTFGLTLYGP